MPMSSKEQALRIIEQLPDDVSLEEIMYALYVRQKIEHGLREADAGLTVDHEEVRRSVVEWLWSAGR